jgi:HEAT repeat protein
MSAGRGARPGEAVPVVGVGGGLSGHPEDLLRGALEKIVYFECRLAQLEGELKAARDVAAREKMALSAAREREVAASAAFVEARSALEGERTQAGELADRVRLLEAERERFLAGLIDQARIAGAPGRGGLAADDAAESADLAGFIAELRAEIEALRPWKAAAERVGLRVDAPDATGPGARADAGGAPPPAVPDLAARFEDAGRIGVTRSDASRLERSLPSRAERSLYEASMDDLASADARDRRRAADALRAMGSRAAAPLVAAAVGRERDPEVKAALLSALGALGEPSAADIAARELGDARPAVRAAALDAMAALAGPEAEPRLIAALADPSAVVRRRSVLLLGFGRGATVDEALASALADRDPGVARAAALALAGRPNAAAQGVLARALDHRQEGVRRAAAEAVARWSGETVGAGSSGEERRRAARRIADRLAELDAGALRDAVVSAAPADAPPATRARTAVAPPAHLPATAIPLPAAPPAQGRVAASPAPAPRAPASSSALAASPRAHAAVAVVDAPGGDLDPLEQAVLLEIRSALRGRSSDEIARNVPGDAGGALRSLVARGAAVLRGVRYFPA